MEQQTRRNASSRVVAPLEQLVACLDLVQVYVEDPERIRRAQSLAPPPLFSGQGQINRKRKSPGADPVQSQSQSRDDSSYFSRSRTSSIGSGSSVSEAEPSVYDGTLERKLGRIVAKRVDGANIAKHLPTPHMMETAIRTPVTGAERLIRECFMVKLRSVHKTLLENNIDSTTPSLTFTFINEFILRDGVSRIDPEINVGCQKPCKPHMGQNIGCEYTKLCECLEYAVVDEKALKRTDPEAYARYVAFKEDGGDFDSMGAPKKFPYQMGSEGRPKTLQQPYRGSREPIYECNENCNCGPRCKTRLVQQGRKVPLTIFKTPNRGWGLYCNEDLIRGEFIDTYLGEVITNQEADRREEKSKDKASYLYSLDKFAEDGDYGITADNCFVVDGEHMGGPTRFINHSCEPNCRQYTVSYNKYDRRVYDLAFFAYEDIPAGTELTFDYMDKDEEEEEDVLRKREAAARDPENMDKKMCSCGASKCRGYLWV